MLKNLTINRGMIEHLEKQKIKGIKSIKGIKIYRGFIETLDYFPAVGIQ